MTFLDVVAFLRKEPSLISQLVSHNYPAELGKVAHIERRHSSPSIVMQEHFKDFYYLATHDVYLLVEKAFNRNGEVDYYLGQWRLARPLIG